jgi:lysophospholipase L1-like esterase
VKLTSPGSRRLCSRLVAALLPLLALASLEGALRVFGFEHPLQTPSYTFVSPDRATATAEGESHVMPDPVLFWRLRPGSHTDDGSMSVADSGFRTAFAPQKAPGTRRVFCLGDSNTYGLHVTKDEAWPSLLDASLPDDVEVLNLGVPGYTSHQGNVLLAQVGEDLTPDDVIVGFGTFNDWVPARGRVDADQQDAPGWHDLRLVQLRAKALGRAIPEDLVRAEPRPTLDLAELATVDHDGLRRVPLAQFEANLRAIRDRSVELGARVVIVAQPLPRVTALRNPIACEYREVGRRLAEEWSAPFVDGWQVFEESGLSDSELFVDFCHPSANGHRLLGEAVREALAGD